MIAALAVAMLLPACGKNVKKTEGVSGKVTLDGQPLANCNVFFSPEGQGDQAVGRTNEAGEYKAQTMQGAADAGTTPGTYKVFFSCLEVVTPEVTNDEGETIKEEVSKEVIPNKYRSAKTTEYTVEVKKGANVFDFDLTSK